MVFGGYWLFLGLIIFLCDFWWFLVALGGSWLFLLALGGFWWFLVLFGGSWWMSHVVRTWITTSNMLV